VYEDGSISRGYELAIDGSKVALRGISEALEFIDLLYKDLEYSDAHMDQSTGLHINISYATDLK
jgi:hypothetical protein